MAKLLSAFVGMSMLGLVSVASAAEPLSDAQLDSVSAGFLSGPVGVGSVNIGNTLNVINVGLGKLKL